MSSPKESQISQQSHGELLADTVLYRDRDPYLGRDSLESLQDALLQGQHFRETIEELYTQSTPGGGNPSWDAEQFESQNIYWSSEGSSNPGASKQEVLALRETARGHWHHRSASKSAEPSTEPMPAPNVKAVFKSMCRRRRSLQKSALHSKS